MKSFRLLVLIMLLAGGFSFYNQPVVACEDADEEILGPVCPKYERRPNDCPCCSDNHCTSNYCKPGVNKCATRPSDD